MIPLVKNGEVPQEYVEEYGSLSLTGNCSLDIMKITQKFAGVFLCKGDDLIQDLAVILLLIVKCKYSSVYNYGNLKCMHAGVRVVCVTMFWPTNMEPDFRRNGADE